MGAALIERVWGTDFLLGFFNDIEHEYPFAGRVKPRRRLVEDQQIWIVEQAVSKADALRFSPNPQSLDMNLKGIFVK